MRPAELVPSPGDRRLYAVKGIGTVRVTGWTWHAATAEAHGRSWQITRQRIWPSVIQAADAAGDIVGEFRGRRLHHNTTLRWFDRELALTTDRLRCDRYILVEDDRTLATIDGTGSGKHPLNITINGTAEVDPGLLLFAAYVVRTLPHKHTSRRRS